MSDQICCPNCGYCQVHGEGYIWDLLLIIATGGLWLVLKLLVRAVKGPQIATEGEKLTCANCNYTWCYQG